MKLISLRFCPALTLLLGLVVSSCAPDTAPSLAADVPEKPKAEETKPQMPEPQTTAERTKWTSWSDFSVTPPLQQLFEAGGPELEQTQLLNSNQRNSAYKSNSGGYYQYNLQWPNTIGTVTMKLSRIEIEFSAFDKGKPFATDVSADSTGKGDWTRVGTWNADGSKKVQTFSFAPVKCSLVRVVNLTDNTWMNIAQSWFWGATETDEAGKKFVHPGGFNSAQDYVWLRQRIKQPGTPQYVAYQNLLKDKDTSLDFVPKPVAGLVLPFYGVGNVGEDDLVRRDSQAIYKQAMLSVLMHDADPKMSAAHGAKVVEIVNAWGEKLQTIEGGNSPLASGWSMASFVRSAEITKYAGRGWTPQAEAHLNRMLDVIFIPAMGVALEKKHGEDRDNWGASIMEASLMTAIFREDRYSFNRFIERWKRQMNADTLPSGEWGEITRDFQHAQFGLAGMVQIAELAHVQGVDLYSYGDNRLYAMLEYGAQILNVGQAVQPPPTNPDKRKWDGVIQNIGGKPVVGAVEPINHWGWEIGYNHFHNRMKMPMPQLQPRIDATRAAKTSDRYIFHWGLGTLTHADLDAKKVVP